MAKTVVVFHSGYGHTERLAKVVAEGAGAALIAIDQNGDISDEAGRRWMRRTPSSLVRQPIWAAHPQFKKFADASSKARSAASGRTKCSAALPTAPA